MTVPNFSRPDHGQSVSLRFINLIDVLLLHRVACYLVSVDLLSSLVLNEVKYFLSKLSADLKQIIAVSRP